MSYVKLTDPLPDMAAALTAALAQHKIDVPVHADLLGAGAVVQLETGATAWLSCVVHDRPETPQVDFITVAIACAPDGAPWVKPNGQHVAVVFWHGVWPLTLAEVGIDTVRRALLMIALGEPQPQVPIPNPDAGGPTEQDALPMASGAHSIRTAIMAATEIGAAPADVL